MLTKVKETEEEKKKNKTSDKTDYSTKEKKQKKAIEAEPHVDASNNRKKHLKSN